MMTQFRGALYAAIGVTMLFALSLSAQTRQRSDRHVGLPQDWTQHHMIFTDRASRKVSNTEMMSPRVIGARLARARAREIAKAQEKNRWNNWRRPAPKPKGKIDWSVNLGATMAPDTFPAKYSFDINATPDCVNDYVVYGLNTGGSPTQANLVALNYLYSGSLPATGVCNNLNGNGTSAAVYWAYQVPNAIRTSTVISPDGSKVAFLEGGTPATFHVLAWKAEGTVSAPKAPPAAANAPIAGSGEMASVALVSPFQLFCPDSPTTASSPYVDYQNDVAYVGADNGCVYRIKNVFCTTASCVASPVAPSLDLTWGSGAGAYLLNTGSVLGSPIFDIGTGNLFVGSTAGEVFGLDTVAQQPMNGSGQHFGGGPNASTVDIVVDSFNQWVYVYSANASGIVLPGTPQLIQFRTTNMLSAFNSSIGGGRTLFDKGPLFGIGFNDAYFTNPDPTTWWVYLCNVTGLGGPDAPALYRVGFNGGTAQFPQTILGNSDAMIVNLNGGTADHCAGSLTEFKGNDGVDRLFFSLANGGQVNYVDISDTPGTPALGPATPATSPGGATGIIVDNVSTASQASSIYYMQLGGTNAVKLTQVSLQ